MRFRSWALVALVALAVLVAVAGTESLAATPPVLILYDHTGEWAWLGEVHALQLANLLGHFRLPYLLEPIESYVAGDIARCYATFYLGTIYDNPLPADFIADVMSSTKTICWLKYNLHQLSWQDPAFAARFGFSFDYLDDTTGYPDITYRGEVFSKYQEDKELGIVTITNPDLCTEMATAWVSASDPAAGSTPYVVRGANLWYVGDVPFSYISEEDRYIIFCDLLHDILGIDHPVSRRAIMRIEDVDPTISAHDLRAVADYLYSQGVPFAVSVVPVYADPLGYYNHGVPQIVYMTQSPEFVSTLKYMVSRGGKIVLHGYTHQYDSTANPYNGATGDDFEFYRVIRDPSGAGLLYSGPVPEDSAAWAKARCTAGRRDLRACRLTEVAWETPHYAASATDYRVFASLFPATIQRVLYFTEQAGLGLRAAPMDVQRLLRGPEGRLRRSLGYGVPSVVAPLLGAGQLYFSGQFFPYVIQRDVYGQKVIPENLGNVEPQPWEGYPARLPEDIIRAASKNLVVRDAWASTYFHPFYRLGYLKEVVQGIKALGYTFVPVSANLE